MKSIVLPGVGVLAAVMLIALGFVAVQAQPAPPTQAPTLPGLEGIPPDQMFSHFMSAQINMTDKNGNPLTIKVTPGTVASIDDNKSITITPNGQTTTQTFGITPNTIIHAMPPRGSVQAFSSGDQVIIVTEGDSTDAVVIAKKQFAGRMGISHPMFR